MKTRYLARKLRISPLLGLMVFSLSGLPAFAQLDEIIVTAQKRAENVQNVPISITAFSGESLAARGLTDLTDVARFVPNFDMPTSNNQRNVSIRIRGIGSSGTNPGIESSVGVFLDGVYMPTGAMAFGELSDINSVEVLRGPQGTLYGRNTPVGALNVTTRRPSYDFEAQGTAGYGSDAHKWVNGFVGGGLADNMTGRLVAWYRDRDGYQENSFTGDDINDASQYGVRGKLLFEPWDSFEVNLIAGYSKIDNECCVAEQIDVTGPFGIATPGFVAAQAANGFDFNNFDDRDQVLDADDRPDDQTDSVNVSLQMDWTLTNEIVLTSITSYQDWENDVSIASDSLRNPVFDINQVQANEIWSQELRVTSPVGEMFDYLGGVYLYRQDTTFDQNAVIGTGATRVFASPLAPFCLPAGGGCQLAQGDTAFSDFDQETRSIAFYGSGTFHVTDQWDVTGGLRWSQDKKEVDVAHLNAPGNSLAFDNLAFRPSPRVMLDRKESSLTWNANTRYNVTENVMLFMTAATGFKSGGFNSRRLPVGSNLEFDSESTITYEGGIKSTWFDGRVQFNATAFRTKLEDFQEATLAASGTGFIVGNSGEQVVKGVEADLVASITDQFTIDSSFAYLNSEYTDFRAAQCGFGETPDDFGPTPSPNDNTCDRTGETPAFAPKFNFTIGGELVQPLNDALDLRLRADYNWRDDQNLIRVTQDSPADHPSYGLMNVRAAVGPSSGEWEFTAFANNVADKAYFIQAARQPLGGLISGGGFAGAGGVVGWYGAPRTWGLQLTVRTGN